MGRQRSAVDVADRTDPRMPRTARTSGRTHRSRSDDAPAARIACASWRARRGQIPRPTTRRGAPGAGRPETLTRLGRLSSDPARTCRADRPQARGSIRSSPRTSSSATSGPRSRTIDGDLHIVLFELHFDGEVELAEVDIVLGERFLLTSTRPAWEPLALAQLRRGAAPLLGGAPTTCCTRCSTASSTATSRCSTALRRPRLARGPGHRDADRLDAQQLSTLKRELIALRRATSPAREVLNQLTNRESTLIDGPSTPLLPGRLRPPHPPRPTSSTTTASSSRGPSTSTCRRSTTTCPRS